MPVFEPYGNA
eukprot:Gb_37329 [translate_table: standard]